MSISGLDRMTLIVVLMAPTMTSAQSENPEAFSKTNSPLVTALWFSHSYASVQALSPSNDRQLKATLIAALGSKSTELPWNLLNEVFEKSTFNKFADKEHTIMLVTMERVLLEKVPSSRIQLFPKVRRHAELLTAQFDLIEEGHCKTADKLVSWIVDNYHSNKPLEIIVICTGNSRRSILGSTMGNIAATYYGLSVFQISASLVGARTPLRLIREPSPH